MDNAISPVVGQWYRYREVDKGGIFQVIDIDADEHTVEVQYFDGDIEELPQDEWRSKGMENCAAPEDWTGPYDGIRRDDLGYSDNDSPRDQPDEPMENEAGALGGSDEDDSGEDAGDQPPPRG